MQDELIVLIDKLRKNYAEDIVKVFFKSRSLSLERHEFTDILVKFYDFIKYPLGPNCAHNFTEMAFVNLLLTQRGNPVLTPTMLGRFL
jgi:hypothetical protein